MQSYAHREAVGNRFVRICYKWAETGSNYIVTKEKDIGIILSSYLKVADQCAAACAKANRMLTN